MTSITSGELNYLIFRYLQESGLTHSAFALGYEAGMHKCSIDGNLVPHGALIKIIQKGLQYLEMEANLSNVSDTDMDEDFSFIQPLDLITKDVYELRQMIYEKKKSQQNDMDKVFDDENDREPKVVFESGKYCKGKEREKDKEANQLSERGRQDTRKEHEKSRDRNEKEEGRSRHKIDESTEQHASVKDREHEMGRSRIEVDEERGKQHEKFSDIDMVTDQKDKASVEKQENGISRGPEPMDVSTPSVFQASGTAIFDVTVLDGHTREVCACAWSPAGSLLASGSGDSTVRIWSIAESINRSNIQNGPSSVLVLQHAGDTANDNNNDITSVDWNCDGSLLATGSCDGNGRIWTSDGKLRSIISRHQGPIFSVKWNKKGDYILSGSLDTTAIVWDVKANELKQQFEFHSGPTLDTDWRSNSSFATSTTKMIYVCKIGENHPIKSFSGHQAEVNSIKWDPTGLMLASGSDDTSAKIWSMKQDKYVHDLREHNKEVYTIRWSPNGQGTNNPNKKLVLATASFDSTVKIWDVELGRRLCNLNGHRSAVHSIDFSPNGEYLASGSRDKFVHIWSLKEDKLVKTYNCCGGIFEVCWNNEGDKLAACTNQNTVCVLDFRM